MFQAERFAYLRLIKTEDGFPIQSDVPQDMQQGKFSVENEEEYIRYIRQKAIWFEPQFRKLLQSIVQDLNECAFECDADGAYATQSEHIAALGIDPSIYKLRFYPSLFRLRGKGADICALQIAPVKDFDRCLFKAAAFQEETSWCSADSAPAARHICDYLRATIYAEDPFVLSLAFAMLKIRCDGLPRVSNYYVGHEDKPSARQVFVNTNCRLFDPDTETEHFAEVQFILQDFFTIRSIQHDYYEITRANSVPELLARPIGEH